MYPRCCTTGCDRQWRLFFPLLDFQVTNEAGRWQALLLVILPAVSSEAESFYCLTVQGLKWQYFPV